MKEIWKDVIGFEGLYQVSNLGNVRALKYAGSKETNIKVLKPILKRNGYYSVNICGKNIEIHRLVAPAFIPNPHNKPQIDHINTIRTDNKVSNLRWVTVWENQHNPKTIENKFIAAKKARGGKLGIDACRHREVYQYSLRGEFVRKWDCMSDAAREYNITSSQISSCCRGLAIKAGGYIWRYTLCKITHLKHKGRPIIQCDLHGAFIREWDRILDAARALEISPSAIRQCLTGKTKKSKGFIWNYKE